MCMGRAPFLMAKMTGRERRSGVSEQHLKVNDEEGGCGHLGSRSFSKLWVQGAGLPEAPGKGGNTNWQQPPARELFETTDVKTRRSHPGISVCCVCPSRLQVGSLCAPGPHSGLGCRLGERLLRNNPSSGPLPSRSQRS